jgi:hypothetical protein
LTEIGGGPVFIIQSFYDFFVVFLYFIVRLIIYGAEANIIDQKIRTELNELEKESIEAKTLCDLGLIYQKTQKIDQKFDLKNIFIIHKIEEKNKKCFFKDHEGTKYSSISNQFIPINDEVEAIVADLDTAIESAVSRIEYKIEHLPLKLMGLVMDYELITNLVLLIGSIIIAFM